MFVHPAESDQSPRWDESYAYLLGLYLGDGYLAEAPRKVFHLRITLDCRYPTIILAATEAMQVVVPGNRVSAHPRREFAAVEVGSYSKRWPDLLPQHGPGPKHLRPISLVDWQSSITRRFPKALVRGLIHSDGSRYLARQRRRGRVYSYPRYSFKNESEDILGIFWTHLRLIGVHCTRSNANTIQVARREAVGLLDEFIGPKR
jgi:hypothetical protein